MNIERFEDLLDTYGGDLGTWPEGERLKAERLMADDEAARQIFDEMQSMEDLLMMEDVPHGGGVDAIMAAIEQSEADQAAAEIARMRNHASRRWGLSWLMHQLTNPTLERSAALVACAIAGFLISTAVAEYSNDPVEPSLTEAPLDESFQDQLNWMALASDY